MTWPTSSALFLVSFFLTFLAKETMMPAPWESHKGKLCIESKLCKRGSMCASRIRVEIKPLHKHAGVKMILSSAQRPDSRAWSSLRRVQLCFGPISHLCNSLLFLLEWECLLWATVCSKHVFYATWLFEDTQKIIRAINIKDSLNHSVYRSMLAWQNQENKNKKMMTITLEMAYIWKEGTDRIRMEHDEWCSTFDSVLEMDSYCIIK